MLLHLCVFMMYILCIYLFICVDGSKISKVDPTHPTLRGFELQYRWENVQEEDFGLGVIVMFCSALTAFFVLFTVVICNSELMDSLPSSQSRPVTNRNRKNRMM